MSKLPTIGWQACIRALENAGYEHRRQAGSHIIMQRKEPLPTRTVPVPRHKTLKQGTLRGIIRLAGLSVDEFVELLRE